MPYITIITDSDSSLPGDLVERYQVHPVPMAIHFCEDSYEAVVDINDTDTVRRIDREGKLDLLERVHTLKKAWSRVIKLSALLAKTRKIEKMCVLHLNAPQMAQDFKDTLINSILCPAEIKLVQVTSGLYVHSSAGMVGTVFVVK